MPRWSNETSLYCDYSIGPQACPAFNPETDGGKVPPNAIQATNKRQWYEMRAHRSGKAEAELSEPGMRRNTYR